MRKLYFLILFLTCINYAPQCFAKATTVNWCGTYFEDNERGYLLVAQQDLREGSPNCDLEEYQKRISTTGSALIHLELTNNRSNLNNWRKFSNHLIEIRGKIRNGTVVSTHFVRDRGN